MKTIKTKKGNRIMIKMVLGKFVYFLCTCEGYREINKEDVKYY